MLTPGSFASDGTFIDTRDGKGAKNVITGEVAEHREWRPDRHADRFDDSDDEAEEMERASMPPPQSMYEILDGDHKVAAAGSTGAKCFFVSKSLAYASDSTYAEHKQLADGSILTCVFELRIKPGHYEVGKSTLTKQIHDPAVKENEMEWFTDQHGVHILTGIMVRRTYPVGGPLKLAPPEKGQTLASAADRLEISELEESLKRSVMLASFGCRDRHGNGSFGKCRYANICWAALQSLHVNPLFLDHSKDVCYCGKCMTLNGVKPVQNLQFIGDEVPHVTPIGFCGFALKTNEQRDTVLEVNERWHACYHGVNVKTLASILESGGLLFPGDVDHNGRKINARDSFESDLEMPSAAPASAPPARSDREAMRSRPVDVEQLQATPEGQEELKKRKHSIFVSASYQYASARCYAPPFAFCGWEFQIILGLRIKPGTYERAPSTLKDTPKDPYVENINMEWYTPRHGCLEPQFVFLCCNGKAGK